MRYYIADDRHTNGFYEVTEAEYNYIFGNPTIRPYAQAVYHDEMAIGDVPFEYREAVKAVVANRTTRFGKYEPDIIGGV